jgi:hypothetical protein
MMTKEVDYVGDVRSGALSNLRINTARENGMLNVQVNK